MNNLSIEKVEQIALQASASEYRHPSPLHPPIIYYKFFYHLAQELQPGLSVELGTAAGGASMHMAEGWADGEVVTIDKGPRADYKHHLAYIKDNVKNWHFWQMDTLNAPAILRKKYGVGKIELLFVDALHTGEQVLKELKAYKDLLANGAVVVFDDLKPGGYNPGLPEVWKNDLKHTSKVDLNWLHPEVGFGALVYKDGDFDNLP